jgi:hypothetical protein
MKRKRIIALSAVAGLGGLVGGCSYTGSVGNHNSDSEFVDSNGLDDAGIVWMSYRPVQCLGNPWEINWLAKGNDYGDYPRDLLDGGFNSEEGKIIRNYFSDEGVEVRDIYTHSFSEVTCASCDCPIGYDLFVSVDENEADIMEDAGFSFLRR